MTTSRLIVVEVVDRDTFNRAFSKLTWLPGKEQVFSVLRQRLPEFIFASIEDDDEAPHALAKRIDRARAHLQSSLDLILTKPRRLDGKRSIQSAVANAIEGPARDTTRCLRASLSLQEVNQRVPSTREAIYSARFLEHWLGQASEQIMSRPGDTPRYKGNPSLQRLLVLLAEVFSTIDPKGRSPARVPKGADGWFIQFSQASLEVLIERRPRDRLPSSEALSKAWNRILERRQQG